MNASGTPDNDNSAETISLTKKLQGKNLASDRSTARIIVEDGEVVGIVEI